MDTKIFSLYNNISEDIKYKYSAQKYGDILTLKIFQNQFINLIKKNKILNKESVFFIGIKHPYSNFYKKVSLINVEFLSKFFGLPIVYSYYEYDYDSKTFYDNQIERKAYLSKVPKEFAEKYKGYNFIAVEDSIITGTTIKAIEKSLDGIAKALKVISIVDLRGKNVKERDLNEEYFKINGIDGLVRLFKEKNYIPTTQLLRTINTLSISDRKYLLDSVEDYNERLLIPFKKYTGKNFL